MMSVSLDDAGTDEEIKRAIHLPIPAALRAGLTARDRVWGYKLQVRPVGGTKD